MSAERWSDLTPRLVSAAVMALMGFAAIWLGGAVFAALVAGLVGIVLWETTRMLLARPGAGGGRYLPALAGIFGALAVFSVGYLSLGQMLLLQSLFVLLGMMSLARDRTRFAIYAAWVIVAGTGLVVLRHQGGMLATFWLVAVVIATDVAGYFAGRIVGGPKFWPRVSPKKTWAGIVAGWIAAGIVGAAFATGTANPLFIGAISALLGFASQMGDAAESALKRYTGIKDSSALIPGHGGVFDRFDALLGAALAMTVIGVLA